MRKAVLALGRIYRNDGQDSWMRVMEETDATDDNVIAGTDNRFLSLRTSGEGSATRMVARLGSTLDSGRVRMRFDMRPPNYWTGHDGKAHRLVVYGGGEAFAQGGAIPSYYADSHFAVGFLAKDFLSLGRRTGVMLRAQDDTAFLNRDTAVEATHWFRFVVDCDLTTRRYTCRVYDQGVDQPQMKSPNGELVETFSDFKFRCDPSVGFSAFGVVFDSGFAVSPWDLAESGRALMDNIEVRELEGLTVIFR